jgi:8-oxo-dGTP pyrophosphatase MutT (NUDIX family)
VCTQPARLARCIAEEGIEPLRRALLAEPPGLPLVPRRGDYDLDPYTRRPVSLELVPAAVLLAIVERAEPMVLFTRRTEHLARHAGQVSLPGGRMHADDKSLVETALRETREETGIESGFVSIAGYLDVYETGTGFAILPVVGLLREGYSLVADPHEVAEIFDVPLVFLMDPTNCRRETGEWRGAKREFFSFEYGSHRIWGATAAIVVNLRERLCP